ncbi:HNH endonuclease [Hymenobacter sp. BRD67]|uniref:HNH endonuclease n=1 Tax=Hymenobacter sp. BRD67 TaxID=2675877 RepID=UPI0015676ACD|nr:HNH endonuclease [Hymenobacter sp. BRD67]QKG54485.1 HNH endonuclease [Hymenobacter sp. BRD67]
MIKLPKPAVLRLRSLTWTVNLMAYRNRNEKPPKLVLNKYNHKKVKETLVNETSGKCAYCESKVTHVYPGDIEHILPKSDFPKLTFEWNNLTFSCSVCNGHKSNYYDAQNPVLNPYSDAIYEHITSSGAMIIHMPGSVRGEITYKLLELNRGNLIERREEALVIFRKYLDAYVKEQNIYLKSLYKKEIIGMISPDKEFSFVLKNSLSFFISKGLNI